MTYTIGEVAEQTALSVSTLRYYDQTGLLPFIGRDTAGNRIFTPEDIEHLQLIENLKKAGMPLKEIKQFFDWFMAGDSTLEQRRKLFFERKAIVEQQIEDLQKTLEMIDYKCWIYDLAVSAGTLDAYKSVPLHETPVNIRGLRTDC